MNKEEKENTNMRGLYKGFLFCVFWFVLLNVSSASSEIDEPCGPESKSVMVYRATFTSGIENHEPVDYIRAITPDQKKIFFYTEVLGGKQIDIVHQWCRNGDKVAEVALDIGGDRWRTWSSKNIFTDVNDEWEVKVFDSFGCMILSASLPVKDSEEIRFDIDSGTFTLLSSCEAIIISNDSEKMVLLRDLGRGIEDIEQRNENGDTFLLLAIRMNNEVAAKDLLDLGASPYVWDIMGKTPHEIAKAGGNKKLIQMLPEIGPETNLPSITYKHTVWSGINLLIRSWAPSSRLETYLENNPDYFEGKNRRTRIRKAFLCAVEYGNIGAIKYLSKYINKIDLMLSVGKAVEHGQGAAIAYLGRLGADLDRVSPNSLPLTTAAAKGNWHLVEGLLSGGADPNAEPGSSTRPLIAAVNCGHINIVRLLLDAGADPTATDKKGQTAADMVCRKPQISWPPDILKRLQLEGECQ